MIGWIIAAAGLVLAHKAQQASSATPATHITVGTPVFGVVSSKGDLGVSREPLHITIDQWQNGPMVPVPTGSRQDVLPNDPHLISDNVRNQMVKLGEFISGAADVRNPQAPSGTSGAVSTSNTSGAGAPSGGTGGSTSFGGGGGFSGGGGGRFLL